MQDLRNRRVACYARYSSALQREASIDDQLRRCREYIVRQGGVVDDALVFSDAAVSGASIDRPGFEKLMRLVDAKPPGIDVIVTEDMSRISRDFVDAAQVFQRLRYLSIPLLGVADGIDTSAQHGKLTYTIKSLVSDMYLDDLRDKTLRGLEGRALAGFSTGGLALGYRSVPEQDAYERVIGHRIVVDDAAAAVVRRIFSLYLEGRSLESIAHQLNDDNVPPARAKTRHRRKGWVSTTVRAMLHNEAYIGIWKYKQKEWRKVPGSNARRPRLRDPSQVIRREYPERRIVDEDTWNAVKKRLAAVRATYVKTVEGAPRGQALGGRQNSYPLSGLLHCGDCGAPMIIHAGTSARYYRCSDSKKRGTCKNKLALREDVAKARLLGAIEDRFRSPAAILYLRKRISEKLGELSREANAELTERRERLARTETRMKGLVHFISEGDQSDTVRKTLLDLEAQAKSERAGIKALVENAAAPIELPSPDFVVRKVIDLRRLVESDPVRAREALRQMFDQGRLLLRPQPEGHYVAESRFFPLAMLRLDAVALGRQGQKPESQEDKKRLDHPPSGEWSSNRCAGRI